MGRGRYRRPGPDEIVVPGPGQESVWDYPRPPRVERVERHVRVAFGGAVIAETPWAYRVLETASPPTYYLPSEGVRMEYLAPSSRRTMCEWKGQSRYWNVQVGERVARNAAWSYPQPWSGYEEIRDCIAFYAGRMDACSVDGQRVVPQPGEFYGGWITPEIVGPFKGEPGTEGW
jgi:uncharacterized protein (DUF427 family)